MLEITQVLTGYNNNIKNNNNYYCCEIQSTDNDRSQIDKSNRSRQIFGGS